MKPLHLETPPPASDLAHAVAAPALRDDEVALWRASLDEWSDAAGRSFETLLARDEAERAHRFHFARDRRRYIAGRGILRTLLGLYLGRPPETVALRYGPNGKPALAAEPASFAGERPIHFNVSHSEGLALFAFARGVEVGVDVERVRELPDRERLAASAFSPRECARLQACPPAGRSAEFFRAWTRQEALLKATGTGLGGEADPRAEAACAVFPLQPAPGFSGALAIARGPTWATFATWPGENEPASDRLFPRRRRVPLEHLAARGPHFL